MTVTFKMNGPIIPSNQQRIYDWLEWEGVSPKSVESELQKANGEEVEILLNSPGGVVTAASEIYTMLLRYPGKVTMMIAGFAASAATIISCAADTVKIVSTGLYMIHNTQTSNVSGDYRNMEQAAAMLKTSNEAMVTAYIRKTKMEKEELFNLMDSTTFLDPKKALEYGFVDEIYNGEENEITLTASFSPSLVSEAKIKEFEHLFLENHSTQPSNEDDSELSILLAKNQWLNLKGKEEKI